MHSVFVRPSFRLLPSDARAESIASIIDLVCFNAEHNSSSTFILQELDAAVHATQPSGDGSIQGQRQQQLHSITHLAFYAATLNCRQLLCDGLNLQPASSRSRAKPAPVALLLESDARSLLYLVCLLWLGVPCLLLSPRLAPNAVNHLLRSTAAQTVIVSKRTTLLAQAALDIDTDTHHVPEKVSLIYAAQWDECFPSALSHQPSRASIRADSVRVDEADCDVLILHSSGTTGLPKPLGFPHRYLLGYAACHAFSEEDDCSGVNVSTLPLFHGFGLLAPCLALSVGMPCCLPKSSSIPTGQSTLALVKSASASSLMTVPSILEDLIADVEFRGSLDADRAAMASLNFVAVGGGAMSTRLGEQLSDMGIRLLNHYGVTEIGALAPIFFPDTSYDWRYLRLRQDLGLELKPTSDTIKIAPGMARYRILGFPFGRDESFEVQDDLECNPAHPKTEIRILGRTDDLIVLASGEKVRPTLLEQAISLCPLVKTVVAIGSGKFELVVIVEPTRPLKGDIPDEEQRFVAAIWPFVLRGNEAMDAHAQVTSEKAVIVKAPDKIIPRTPKGSIMRKETDIEFAEEIDRAYRQLGSQSKFRLDYNNLEASLRDLVNSCLPHYAREREWTNHHSVFELGVDSLQAIRLQRVLEISIAKNSDSPDKTLILPKNFAYLFDTVAKMANAIRQPESLAASPTSRRNAMESLLNRFRAQDIAHPPQRLPSSKYRVLLTGSTGSIGSHILDSLCRNLSVDRVTCLIRAAGAKLQSVGNANSETSDDDTLPHDVHRASQVTQMAANRKHGIALRSQDWSRIEFVEWRPGANRLGLDEQQWIGLAQDVTHIVHCAWPMDFQRSLQSFEPHVEVIRSLSDLALLAGEHQPGLVPRLVVMSSIATVGRYPLTTAKRSVPEKLVNDPLVTLPMGYAEAKWVCEHALDTIAQQHAGKIDAIVLRLGQITGSTKTGYWNPKEHLPALFQASRKLGKLPQLEGDVSWLPVDVASEVILDLLFAPIPARKDYGTAIFHVENPIRRRWSDIIPVVARRMGLSDGSSVPFPVWYKHAVEEDVLDELLQEFVQGHFLHMSTGLVLDTTSARAHSRTLRSVGAPSYEVIGSYVDT